jgi:5-methylcytosine-specific restriction endonuclease McrA
MKKPRKPKTERKKLIDILDELSKDVVRARDGYNCVKCGKYVEGTGRHVSHVIPVSAGNKLRWDPMNMKILCFHHHINWWHKNPLEASAWFTDKYPERWEYLQSQRGIAKFNLAQLEDIRDSLQEQLESYETNNKL